ncbi:MAG: phosphonopyruvate decarboxylase [Rhodospirillales bacterium]
MADKSAGSTAWQDQLYDTLKDAGVSIFSYVPDAGHKILINRSLADPDVHSIRLTTEEEGVSLAAGAHLGGAKSVLLMQSSGVGNCVNMFSLMENGRFPFLTYISMRGDFGEENPWQIAMGRGTQPVMEAMGLKCIRVDSPEDIITATKAALGMAFKSNCAVAVLLTQKLLGAKGF